MPKIEFGKSKFGILGLIVKKRYSKHVHALISLMLLKRM